MLRSVVLACVGLLLTSPLPAFEPGDAHVVLISVDGLPAYLLDDPQASLPNIRGLAKSGSFSPTGMRVSNPSVTWPNHTTLASGFHPAKHGVLFNGLAVRPGPGQPVEVDPKRTQQDLVQVPLIFDTLKQAGLTSAAINWPCTRGSKSIDDNFPDVPDTLEHSTPRLMQELRVQGILPSGDALSFEKRGGVARDEIWTDATCYLLRERKPRFLCLHLLNVDAVHHRYGPQTPAGYSAVAAADAMVGKILRTLEETRLRDRTTVLIVADHGFLSIPKTLQPNVLLRKENLLTVEGKRISSARVHVIPEGGIGMLYLTVPETRDQDREAALRIFREAEGIASIVEPAEFGKYHLPAPADNRGMADLILAAKDGYGFSATADGDDYVVPSTTTIGTHGYLSTHPKMNAIFVAAGAGIKPGAPLKEIDNVDVAPTAARLLGVTLEGVDGRVLTEILK